MTLETFIWGVFFQPTVSAQRVLAKISAPWQTSPTVAVHLPTSEAIVFDPLNNNLFSLILATIAPGADLLVELDFLYQSKLITG